MCTEGAGAEVAVFVALDPPSAGVELLAFFQPRHALHNKRSAHERDARSNAVTSSTSTPKTRFDNNKKVVIVLALDPQAHGVELFAVFQPRHALHNRNKERTRARCALERGDRLHVNTENEA